MIMFNIQGLISYLLVYLILSPTSVMTTTEKLVSVDFEVFGKVQGVFFRKYTQKEANRLGLKGWCMNTEQDTVKGTMEGEQKKVKEMKNWLEKVGSPSSRIDRAVFSPEKEIKEFTFKSFTIKR